MTRNPAMVSLKDAKLPGLSHALSDDTMRLTLSVALREAHKDVGMAWVKVRHRMVKHKPGKHCVIAYRLEAENWHRGARRIIGKMYRGSRGAKHFAHLQSLWAARNEQCQRRGRLGMPKPLAYIEELGMVLQGMVAGRSLATFSARDDLHSAVRHVARNLSALHSLSMPLIGQRTLRDHITKHCRPGPYALMEACPEVALWVKEILVGLEANDRDDGVPLCPVHGDLGLGQIFVTKTRAAFVDFDGFCLAPAALDIANFLVALQVYFQALSAPLSRAFFDEYLARRPEDGLAALPRYYAFIYLRRAMICFRVKGTAAWRQQVRRLLETGHKYVTRSSGLE